MMDLLHFNNLKLNNDQNGEPHTIKHSDKENSQLTSKP